MFFTFVYGCTEKYSFWLPCLSSWSSRIWLFPSNLYYRPIQINPNTVVTFSIQFGTFNWKKKYSLQSFSYCAFISLSQQCSLERLWLLQWNPRMKYLRRSRISLCASAAVFHTDILPSDLGQLVWCVNNDPSLCACLGCEQVDLNAELPLIHPLARLSAVAPDCRAATQEEWAMTGICALLCDAWHTSLHRDQSTGKERTGLFKCVIKQEQRRLQHPNSVPLC